MIDPSELPFKVHDLIETKSFMNGFRGAWFECKIKEVGSEKRKGRYLLEYVTYPDQKATWTYAYQRAGKSKDAPRHLMLRPSFPRVCHENQMPDLSTISEVAVIFNDVLKVGDLVDWWSDGCFWSGKITEILSARKFKIELPTPPDGEGSSYEVLYEDLRPSLEWSLVDGWTLPAPKESENSCPCARLIKPLNGSESQFVRHINQGISPMHTLQTSEGKDVLATKEVFSRCNAALSSHISPTCLQPEDKSDEAPTRCLIEKEKQPKEKIIDLDDDEDSRSLKKMKIDETGYHGSLEKMKSVETDEHGSSKKMKAEEAVGLNSMRSDTIEAAVLDLEELISKVKWIRGILEYGTPASDTRSSSWKFVEHRASSMPKK